MRLSLSLAWLVALSAVACGDNSVPPFVPPTDDGGADPPVVEDCEPVTGEPDLTLEVVADGFDRPVHMASPPGDPRLFVLEQHTGDAWVIVDGEVLNEPFFSITELSRAFEQGLVGLTFHPDYALNGRFFVAYTAPDDALHIQEWQVSGDPNLANPDTRRDILVIEQPTDYHQGGRMQFGMDGYLYIGLGDGGPQHDPEGNAQNLGSLLGKFIRIDVDNVAEGELYRIPPDNPFVDEPGARPEVYALGVRNPWGWSIDRATGHLYFGDVGLSNFEEISVLPGSSSGGENFGWAILHGTSSCEVPGCDPTPYVPPIYEYPYVTQMRCSVVGGYVYRGCKMPGHHGKYFFTDFCSAEVQSFYWSEFQPTVESVTLWQGVSDFLFRVSAFGQDHEGELYVVEWEDGILYKIVPVEP